MFRRLWRRLFSRDRRFDRLVRYAQDVLGQKVIFDDERLKEVIEHHRGRTNLEAAIGCCVPAEGGPIVLSPTLDGDEKVFVLMHEIGHALDFKDPKRLERWGTVWEKDTFSADDRDFILDIEGRAFELGRQLARAIDVDVDEDAWMKHVGQKTFANIQAYGELSDVVI